MGARYVVITTKHCDDFALWATQQKGGRNVVDHTPAGRDLIAPLCAALRRAGLKVGLYYSHSGWGHPDYPTLYKDPAQRGDPRLSKFAYPQNGDAEDPAAWTRYLAYQRGQIRELCEMFQPDLLWFDADWERTPEQWGAADLVASIRQWCPNVVLNNRTCHLGDYSTPEQGLPTRIPEGPWELCLTIDRQWGYTEFELFAGTNSPDANSANGLSATNVVGSPAGVSTGFRAAWGASPSSIAAWRSIPSSPTVSAERIQVTTASRPLPPPDPHRRRQRHVLRQTPRRPGSPRRHTVYLSLNAAPALSPAPPLGESSDDLRIFPGESIDSAHSGSTRLGVIFKKTTSPSRRHDQTHPSGTLDHRAKARGIARQSEKRHLAKTGSLARLPQLEWVFRYFDPGFSRKSFI